tara:strand:+ start:10232 stop:11416 length:1185 start_codon:yes stop_codon:yes gene_type:complete
MSYEKYKNVRTTNKNATTAKKSFRFAKAYARLYPKNLKYFSFREGKSSLYGKIDSQNNAVIINEAHLAGIKNDQNQEIQCLHFVADAFKEMRRYISLQATRKILPDDFVSTGWDARRGWESPHVFYDKKIKDIYELFITKTLIADNKQTKIVDIEDFLQVFLNEFYYYNQAIMPLTKSGFITHKVFTPTATGLCIETSLDDFSEDRVKILKFIKSPNFKFYVLAAAKYGFLVDKDAPWRLVANINSPNMQKYMNRYGISPSNVFDTCYVKTHLYDIQNLQVYMHQMYTGYTSAYPIVVIEKETYEGQPCPIYEQPAYEAKRRQKILFENFMAKHDELFWLKLYYRIRLNEVGVTPSDALLTRELASLEQLYNSLDYEQSLEYINSKVKSQIPWV